MFENWRTKPRPNLEEYAARTLRVVVALIALYVLMSIGYALAFLMPLEEATRLAAITMAFVLAIPLTLMAVSTALIAVGKRWTHLYDRS